jgi:hypothetical protein
MRFFDDLSPRRIARRLGVPPATVRTRIHRGLAELRRTLGERDPDGWRLALLPLAAKRGRAPCFAARKPEADPVNRLPGIIEPPGCRGQGAE